MFYIRGRHFNSQMSSVCTTPGKLKSYSFFLTTTQSILGIFASGLLLRELDSTEIKMI